MLQQLLTAELFAMMMIFARLGSALMLLPGFGETSVTPRVRLLIAGTTTIVIAPVLAPRLPPLPSSPVLMALLLGGEIGVGIFIGTVGRMLMTALETAGTLISFQMGLASASIFNPLVAEQGSLPGLLLAMLGIVLFFETDMHHLTLRAIVDSYSLFVPGALPPIGDFTEMITRMVSRSFRIAMQLSAPFLLINTLLYVALGLLARLMPQLQVFFVALPVQLILGFLLIVTTLSTAMLWFFDSFGEVFRGFLVPAG